MQNYGGNEVQQALFQENIPTVFSSEPYYYGLQKLSPGTMLALPNLLALTIFAYDVPNGCQVTEKISGHALRSGDALQVHKTAIEISVSGSDSATFLVAGVGASTMVPSVSHIAASNVKKVIKPWGHELWISGEHSEYALKQVFIRHPYKTSLQFHNFKQETIVLFSGNARLHYKKDAAVSNEQVKDSNVGTIELTAPIFVHIKPPVLHRFEALTDLTLYEASTPHLHDVIRVSDDSRRPDGKIESEHQSRPKHA